MSKKWKIAISVIGAVLTIVIIAQFVVLFNINTKQSAQAIQPHQIEQEVVPASIRGKILTDTGTLITGGIIVEYPNGNIERLNSNVLSGYNLKLSTGDYKLRYTRGLEYSIVEKEVKAENFKIFNLDDVRLVQLHNSTAKGWYAGDLHQHSNNSDGSDDVDNVLLSNINNGLMFGFLSDHNSAMGLGEWAQGKRLTANIDAYTGKQKMFSPFEAVEVTTIFGHYQSIGSGQVLDQWDIEEDKSEIPKDEVVTIAREIKRNGGVAQINHPYAMDTMGFNFWDIANEFDTIEIWNGKYQPNRNENLKAKEKWYELLNSIKNGGKYFPATSGTDNHSISAKYIKANAPQNPTEEEKYKDAYLRRGLYSGVPSIYLKVDGELTQGKVLNAVSKGNSFLTNGPLVYGDIEGKIYGETYKLNGKTSVMINLQAFCREQLTKIDIVKNGKVVKTVNNFSGMDYADKITIDGVSSGDWITFEAYADGPIYAITNPIFLQ